MHSHSLEEMITKTDGYQEKENKGEKETGRNTQLGLP